MSGSYLYKDQEAKYDFDVNRNVEKGSTASKSHGTSVFLSEPIDE